MHFEVVKVDAFGPLVNGELPLKPGLNIVHGPNEAGKSSWHGALFAALCGRRRGRGPSGDQPFVAQYQPWSGERWQVSARITLANGRRIELRHDLENRVDCSAVDLQTGRDISGEIINDGAPDGSVLLGLDRRSFYAIATVRQAEIQGIKGAARALQAHLERAATTAAATSTAADALRIIDVYRREKIGSTDAPTKPLVAAERRLRAAQEQLRIAEQAQADLEALRDKVEKKREEATAAESRVRLVEAQLANVEALVLERRLATADRLVPLFPEGEPRQLSDDAATANNVATALHAWEQRPRDPSLSNKNTKAVEQALSDLPDPGDGDLDEDAVVRAAAEKHHLAVSLLEEHRNGRPTAVREQVGTPSAPSWRTPALLAGLAACMLGVILILAELMAMGVVVAVAGAGLAAYAFLSAGHAAPLSGPHAWREREAELLRRVNVAERELREALASRGVSDAGEVGSGYERYREACQLRRRRAELGRCLAELRRLEEAKASLRRAAAGVGLDRGAQPDELAEALRSWQAQRGLRLQEQDTDRRNWTDLREALGGLTVEELRAAALRRRQEAEDLRAAFSADELAAVELEEDAPGQLQSLRASAQRAREELARLEARLSEQEARFPDLAAAAEERQLAEEDLARLRDLDRILERTRGFLVQAAERAHRNIAPALQATLQRWLPQITLGRYTETLVDPKDLLVRVRGPDGNWREAERLSHGTAEQVYLLLHVALAEHLGKRDEPCPLILDDVTAHSDPERTVAILDALAAISEARQVIFFSQEAEVLDWARVNDERCNLIQLPILEPAG